VGQPVTRPLPAHRTTQTQTSMTREGFEPTIAGLYRTKTVHALHLDRAATVIGYLYKIGLVLSLLVPVYRILSLMDVEITKC
jgi:hypothetical protein